MVYYMILMRQTSQSYFNSNIEYSKNGQVLNCTKPNNLDIRTFLIFILPFLYIFLLTVAAAHRLSCFFDDSYESMSEKMIRVDGSYASYTLNPVNEIPEDTK